MHALFQKSYLIEAKLLVAVDFPPLKRTIQNFMQSNTEFYAYQHDNRFVGVVEVKKVGLSTMHVQSLVVDPQHFRQGIARKLLTFIFDNFDAKKYTVETGLNNLPAIALYTTFGFTEVDRWDTDHGVRKVKFIRSK